MSKYIKYVDQTSKIRTIVMKGHLINLRGESNEHREMKKWKQNAYTTFLFLLFYHYLFIIAYIWSR